MAHYSDVAGVRIIPPVVEFKDSEANVSYRMNITVKNVGERIKTVRYYPPTNTEIFELQASNLENSIASGLEVPGVIIYEPKENKAYSDRIMVTVDDVIIEVPIKGTPALPKLVIDGPVNFGDVIANSKVISRQLNLSNHGSKAGEFKIKYTGNKPITIIPSSGSVPPKSIAIINVEFVTRFPIKFDEVAKVKLEGQPVSSLHIKGNIVEGSLELLSADTNEPLDCVKFGTTYYGTDCTSPAVLYNNGPAPVSFVAILNDEAEGQELGVDLSKSTNVMLASQQTGASNSDGEMNKISSLVTAFPNQAVLMPYEKTPIFFRFSPRWNASSQGFKTLYKVAPRKDFALFIQLKVVGASQSLQDKKDVGDRKSNVEGMCLEVALTGTAVPVELNLQPKSTLDFGECPVRERVDILCMLCNDCSYLPASFKFQRVAHFSTYPSEGKVLPGRTQEVIFSFAPNQVGTFKPTLYLDVLGQVADDLDPFELETESIFSMPLHFIGSSDSITLKKKPVFNSGITPKISNEVGMFVESTSLDAAEGPAMARLPASNTRIHHSKSSKDRQNKARALIAFPNDRAASIRPSDRRENFRTIFTKVDRHTYVDPDYAYTDEETFNIQKHKEYYLKFINYLRETRINKETANEFKETNNPMDITIKPAAGLKPKKLLLSDVKPDPRPPTPPNSRYQLLGKKKLAEAEKASMQRVTDGLNAVPTTPQEKIDCSKMLCPQELHHVIVGPPTIDFGEVCIRSLSQRELTIVNNLEQFIHIVVHIDCRELRQTSPLSQVVPPCSKAMLPLIFDSCNKGHFQRSMDYTINGSHKNHVTVFANVVPVNLELSTNELFLEPVLSMPHEAGLRGVVTLRNKLNLAAEFTWTPILGERGTAFSIRPATGMVDANMDLDCEVVFHPSFLAPEQGFFALQVHSGPTLDLKCIAKLGPTNVQFIDRRVVFGQVPLHLTTTRVAMISNKGHNHSFFHVLDPHPFPGLTVSPIHGVIPVGGSAELSVKLIPNAVIKFDTRVQVAIRGSRPLELRMGGTVEPPIVDIDVNSFNFGGVYCGSVSKCPFRLANRTNTKTRIEFDLSRYTDFSLSFPGKQTAGDFSFQLMNPGLFSITMDTSEVINGQLVFSPQEVASYDFVVPVTINQTGAPTPSPTPFPPTPAPSHKNSLQHIIKPRPIEVTIATPRRKVIATALRQPLQLSHKKLEFLLQPDFCHFAASTGIGQTKNLLLVNNSDKLLKWGVDVSVGNQILEDGVFRFMRTSGIPFMSFGQGAVNGSIEPGQTQSISVMFFPNKPGHFEVSVPLVINDDWDKPYSYLTLVGKMQSPRLWFDPLAIVLIPVPLETEVGIDFKVMAANYTQPTTLEVEVPKVESDIGIMLSPVTVTFLTSNKIQPKSPKHGHEDFIMLKCRLVFRSAHPISFCKPVVFSDGFGNDFSVMVTATADNCLFTCYPFLAKHRSDHQIICEQGYTLKGCKTSSRESVNVGEAVLVPCESPLQSYSRPSTTATSSNFETSSSSYEATSPSMTESVSQSTLRDGAMNNQQSEVEVNKGSRNNIKSRSLGSALFPEEDSEEGIFHTEVLVALQRWFSSQAWPAGPHPSVIPHSFRNRLSKKPTEEKSKTSKGGTWEANNLNKEFMTVYDMISNLSGKQVPGIPINSPPPSDPVERAKVIYWQHNTLLTFIKAQGGCVSSIKPEYLLEPADYKAWVQLQKQIDIEEHSDGHREIKHKTEEEEAIEEQLFEAVSKRAWTDVLLQLLKTLVLARITPRQFKQLSSHYAKMPRVDPDPLCSNVYGLGERILLIWLNHHYEEQRTVAWNTCTKGGVPPSRWIVNFDFDLLDGLVLAALISAHAPFLVETHLHGMYTQPETAEQCLHNALKVVSALRTMGIDYDIQAIDITDPNPISLLLLCIHLYNHLPHYLSKNLIEFVGGLHSTVVRQVRLSNPSNRPLMYQAMLEGKDAKDFFLPKGMSLIVPPRSTQNVSVEFTSRFLRSADTTLMLVGRRQGSNVGSTLVFNLHTQVDNISPRAIIRFDSPCYELSKIPLEITNPFPRAGTFKIVLVEARGKFLHKDAPEGFVANAKKPKAKPIKSRTNHGQKRTPPPSTEPEPEVQEVAKESDFTDANSTMSAFHSSLKKVELPANGTSTINIEFLPFMTGKRQCSVIFINEEVGEFLYSIEATAGLPLPGYMPFSPNMHSVRVSSAAAAGSSRGYFGGAENVVYWKSQVAQSFSENIFIPIINPNREKALVIAAQQHITQDELDRRLVTGTLNSSMLTAKTVSILLSHPGSKTLVLPKFEQDTVFTIEIDSQFYGAPKIITMPSTLRNATVGPSDVFESPADLERTNVTLPLTFHAKEAGHYPCVLILRSNDDIRVYNIECTVSPAGSDAQIEFTSPVHQPVTQNIPIINPTNHDWNISAKIEGSGFSGATKIIAKAFQTTQYPLLFKPKREGLSTGILLMDNTTDNAQNKFTLIGKGQQPLPLDQLTFNCVSNTTASQVIQIPNVTNHKLRYKAQSDLEFVSGKEIVTVLPGKTAEYKLTVAPMRKGAYKGLITFVNSNANNDKELDSDGDEVNNVCSNKDNLEGYQVWFSIEVFVEAPPSRRTINIKSACQKKMNVGLNLNNPTNKDIVLSVTITPNNVGLTGPEEVSLLPNVRGTYVLEYAPSLVGNYTARVEFYNSHVGEFWYHIELTAEKPEPTIMPRLECELGRWVQQIIKLTNPTDRMLTLVPAVSNTNNFVLERKNDQPIKLRPNRTLELPVTFMPSELGKGDHNTTICFHSERIPELGEWVYMLSGCGRLPRPQDPVSIAAMAGSNATLIIPFRNPLDIPVIADIILTDKEPIVRTTEDLIVPHSPFCLLLKHSTSIRLGPKTNADIPISFAPLTMTRFDAILTISLRKENGNPWTYNLREESELVPGPTESKSLSVIKWEYLIYGYPELTAPDMEPAVVMCKARDRVEECLEVTLSGVAPAAGGPKRGIRTRVINPVTDTAEKVETDDTGHVVISEAPVPVEEFTFKIIYTYKDVAKAMKSTVALNLMRATRCKHTGLVQLVFNVVYAPYMPMTNDCQLLVTGATGGIWKFPLRFIATEPEPDDVITINAIGLNKEASVAFRLNSMADKPVPYRAYFMGGSQIHFGVSPAKGELLPANTKGTLIQVTFVPTKYGKVHEGKLVVHTDDMQWTYSIRGEIPEYQPPCGIASRPIAGPHPDLRYRPRQPLNYVRSNLKLMTTAVSSPIKGLPIVKKNCDKLVLY